MSTIESDENLMDLCEVCGRTRKYFGLRQSCDVGMCQT